MDQKSWLWRKKTSHNITVSADEVNLSLNKNEEKTLIIDKARLEKDLEITNDKLSVALSECKTKDELVKKLTNMEQEAIAKWENSKSEAATLKQQLNDAVQKMLAGEERVIHLDAALKECMQKLRLVREETEQRIHDAVSKTSNEFEKSQKILEEKLADSGKRLSKSVGEITQLGKTLLVKEKIIEALNKQLAEMEVDLNALVSRLESAGKENGALKYEVRVLEKEVEIRNEEREFNRRTADASHKQYLESVKKIAKLESECQRLRLLVQKRLPGPAALVKMKNEVDMLGRRKSNNPRCSSLENSPETPIKRINVLTTRVSALEEENSFLKVAPNKKYNELRVAKIFHEHASTKPLHIASTLPRLPVALMSDAGSDDKVSTVESWASTLISEVEHFENGKQKGTLPTTCKIVGSSDLDLMDDFVEMEKLAIVSVQKSVMNSLALSDEVNGNSKSLETELNVRFPEVTSKETVPTAKVPDCRQNILKCQSSANDFSITSKQSQDQVDLRGSISRLIEIVEGICVSSTDYDKSSSEKDAGYIVRVFQWKTSELNTTLKQFIHNCHDLLNAKESVEIFLQELNSTLDWIMNHCFSIQDVSSMRDSIKKHFDWDKSRSDSDQETGTAVHVSEVDRSRVPTGELQPTLIEENRKLKEELTKVETAKNDLEAKFQSTTGTSETLTNQLQESEKKIDNLEKELEMLGELKGTIESQIVNQHLVNQDLDAQLTAARNELNENRGTLAALEVELENRNNCYEELEATCLELQLQLESTRKQNPSTDLGEEDKQLRTEWEITTASEKLAECQETIFDLGKQLKALATPKEAAFLDKIISTPNDETQTSSIIVTPTSPTPTTEAASTPIVSNIKTTNNRFSLLDQMLAEDDVFPRDHKISKPVEVDANHISTSDPDKEIDPHKAILIWNGHKSGVNKDAVGNLAIVPSRKLGDGGLWRKLLWRKKSRFRKKPF